MGRREGTPGDAEFDLLAAGSLIEAAAATVARLGDDVAIRDPARGVDLTWNEMRIHVNRIAAGLARLGIGKGDTVALLMTNRWEFVPCDLGVMTLGAVPFSIYQTSAPEQVQHQLTDAGARLAFVQRSLLARLQQALLDSSTVETVIVVDGDGGDYSLAELEQLGRDETGSTGAVRIAPDDVATLIYTSGTTGPPKGVQLTHRNLLGLVAGLASVLGLPTDGGKVISWLPSAHIAERGASYYLPMCLGFTIWCCDDPRALIDYLPRVRPTWFFAVPRIWEKIKARIELSFSKLPEQQRNYVAAGLAAAIEAVRCEQRGEVVPEPLAAQAAAVERDLFIPLRAQLGLDEVVAVSTGGAPVSREVLEFFHGIGIEVGELWGLSETCGLATVNPPGKTRLGTVGLPLPGAELRLGEDGEVFVRGPTVMAGYRNDPVATAAALNDGWLATGDVGVLDCHGYLTIVDRKKELIVNAAGKNMSPAGIEAKLKASSPLIGHAVVIGDRRRYNVALLILESEVLSQWAAERGLHARTVTELADHVEVVGEIRTAVRAANERLSRVEQIKTFRVLGADWEPGGDELTPTSKLKRREIARKYEHAIEELYQS